MRINNNIMALNANRQFAINNANVASSTEKLSSGYRINRAGDDAAGLAISEKMRAQIRGLDMASKNSQDAISLVQTAEGALQEVHSMLQRMNELATQSATGTNEDVDREAISAEFEALKSEINDISDQTNFNNMKLLDGSFGTAKVAVSTASTLKTGSSLATANGSYSVFSNTGMTASKAGTFTLDVGSYDATTGKFTSAGAANGNGDYLQVNFTDATSGDVTNTIVKIDSVLSGTVSDGESFTLNLSAAGLGTYSFAASDTLANGATESDFLSVLDDKTVKTIPSYTVSGTGTASGFSSSANGITAAGPSFTGIDLKQLADVLGTNGVSLPDDGALNITLDVTALGAGTVLANGTSIGTFTATAAANNSIDLSAYGLGNLEYTGTGTTALADVATDLSSGSFSFSIASASGSSSGAMKVQVGANEGDQLSIAIGKMDSASLGLTNADIGLQDDAGRAITLTKAAINTVSSQRASLGALQNRLQHKINNLDTSSENLQAAESRIRDLDMAEEMTEFTKNNILVQASTSMLAQANSAPQAVLKLLQ